MHDMGDDYPQELRTMLQFSLQHRITYWLRTCTPKETDDMTTHVDCCIMEAVEAATGVDFETDVMAKERLRLLARLKGRGIKRTSDTGNPTFLGALMHNLPRCVDMEETNGEVTKGIYSEQLTKVIGEGAYDENGHKNTQFLAATGIGPYPREMQRAWDELRDETADNYGLRAGVQDEEAKEKLRPLAEPRPAIVRNRGAAERKKTRGVEAFMEESNAMAANAAGEEGRRRGGGDAHRQQEEGEEAEEDMEALMDAVARAISQT